MVLYLRTLLCFLALALTATATGEPFRTAQVETELHSGRAAIAPGEHFTVLLRQSIASGWHTYWRNPGDSGAPTTIDWRLPRGFSAGEMQWPTPEPVPFSILLNYGYGGEVLFPIEITAPLNAAPGGSVTLNADVSWLVCSDVCIPQDGRLSLTLPVAAQGRDDPVWASRVMRALRALPRRAAFAARITAGDPGVLSIAAPHTIGARNLYFFPFDQNANAHAAPQLPQIGANGISFRLKPGVDDDLGSAPLDGVLSLDTQNGRQAFEIRALPGAPLPNTTGAAARFSPDYPIQSNAGETPAPNPPPSAGLLSALLFAFIGGLILNAMPCVLPVLSLKALSLTGGAHAGQARRHGLIYLAGVVATFLALAVLLIVMRGAGEALGWGFQLQIPWVSAVLALLFFAIGLNLLGVFEIGIGQNTGAGLASRGGDLGAFFTGALAVVAATPCTAPFMAGAIGAVLTQSTGAIFAVFTALALGFAAPLTALSFAPSLQRALPKPGPWMARLRSVLAFPMFAAAVWLAWVLTQQAGSGAALALLSLATALAFALLVSRWGRVWLAIGVLVLALTGVLAWRPLSGQRSDDGFAAEPWSAARVVALQAEGRGVLVNFTADWCVTCKLNEAIAFTPRVAETFAARRIAYLKGDWTNRDASIAAALAEHSRAGVPLYLYYPPGSGEPIVLPQLLNEKAVLSAIGAPSD